MKSFHFLLAAGLLSFSAAAAQTTPGSTVPSNPGPAGTASPSMPASGMTPPVANPKGNVGPGEVFTKGSPSRNQSDMRRRKTRKSSMDGTKMKTKM